MLSKSKWSMKSAWAERPGGDTTNMTNVSFEDVLISFGHGTKEEKKAILRRNSGMKVYMDLTCFDPQEFYAEFPQLKGSFAALFCDDARKIEIHFRERDVRAAAK